MSRVKRVGDKSENSGQFFAGWQPAKSNVAFGEKNKGRAEQGENRTTDKLTAWHKYQQILDLTPTEQYRRTAGYKSPEMQNTG